MPYVFTNQNTGKATITDDNDTTLSLAGINTKNNDANAFMNGIGIMLDIVGWTVQDAVRVVNQDVEESE